MDWIYVPQSSVQKGANEVPAHPAERLDEETEPMILRPDQESRGSVFIGVFVNEGIKRKGVKHRQKQSERGKEDADFVRKREQKRVIDLLGREECQRHHIRLNNHCEESPSSAIGPDPVVERKKEFVLAFEWIENYLDEFNCTE